MPLPHIFNPWRRETIQSTHVSQAPGCTKLGQDRREERQKPDQAGALSLRWLLRETPGTQPYPSWAPALRPTWPTPDSWPSTCCTPSAAAQTAPAGLPSSQPASPGPASQPGSLPYRYPPRQDKRGVCACHPSATHWTLCARHQGAKWGPLLPSPSHSRESHPKCTERSSNSTRTF